MSDEDPLKELVDEIVRFQTLYSTWKKLARAGERSSDEMDAGRAVTTFPWADVVTTFRARGAEALRVPELRERLRQAPDAMKSLWPLLTQAERESLRR